MTDSDWYSNRIEVSSDLNCLPQVLDWLDRQQPIYVPENFWMELRFALAEGFTNAVRHAHANLPASTPVIINIDVNYNAISLRIWDLGTPFDLSATFNEIEKLNLSPLERDSQWGIIMLMKLQKNHGWHIQYSPVEKVGNCLLVCKSIINNTNLRTE